MDKRDVVVSLRITRKAMEKFKELAEEDCRQPANLMATVLMRYAREKAAASAPVGASQ